MSDVFVYLDSCTAFAAVEPVSAVADVVRYLSIVSWFKPGFLYKDDVRFISMGEFLEFESFGFDAVGIPKDHSEYI